MSVFLEIKQKDYSKSIIYRIVCKDLSIDFTYVGSTTNSYHRHAQHRSDCCNINSPRYKLPMYEFMRNNGNWNNFVMLLVEEFCCENKRELEKREQYWKEIYKDNIGKNSYGKKAYLSPEQKAELNKKYYQDNKEEIKKQKREQYAVDKSYRQKYYKEHKEQILLKAKEAYANKLKVKHGLN
jgi:hypothetical protein